MAIIKKPNKSESYTISSKNGDFEVRILKFEKKYAQAVRDVYCDTAFLGNPIDPIFIDRELFANLGVQSYINKEPENGRVIVDSNDRVLGYAFASLDPLMYLKNIPMFINTLFEINLRKTRGLYDNHERSKKFADWVLKKSWMQLVRSPYNSGIGHCHLRKEVRGSMLIELQRKAKELCIENGKKVYSLQVLSHSKKQNEKIYKRFGFQELRRKKFDIFTPPLENAYMVCLYKYL